MSDYETAAKIFGQTRKPTKDLQSTAVIAACADHLFTLSMTDGGSEETVESAISWLKRRMIQHRQGELPKHLRDRIDRNGRCGAAGAQLT